MPVDPPVIAYLRDKLAREYRLDGDEEHFVTLVVPPGTSMMSLRVRPKLHEERPDGTRIVGLNRRQAAKVVRLYDDEQGRGSRAR